MYTQQEMEEYAQKKLVEYVEKLTNRINDQMCMVMCASSIEEAERRAPYDDRNTGMRDALMWVNRHLNN